jgi:hypothetical protein
VFFVIANEMDLDMDHLDTAISLLKGKLHEIIYMEQLSGYEVEGDKV